MFRRKNLDFLNNWYRSKKRKPLVLRGARQVGKSFLVHLFAREQNLNLIEINFEIETLLTLDSDLIRIESVVEEIEFKTGRKLNPKKDLIFFDEIQKKPQAFMSLRYFFEKKSELAIIAAGSLLDFLFQEQKVSIPVGRIEFHFLGPVTFGEYLLAKKKDLLLEEFEKQPRIISSAAHKLLVNEWNSYLVTGGMPECVQAEVDGGNFFQIRKIQKNIFNTYKADILKYSKGTQIIRCETVFDYVPGHIGQKVKYSEIDSDERAKTLKEAIQLLISARIILPVIHTNATSLPLISVSDERVFKLFHLDVGLVSAALQIQTPLISSSPSYGAVSEQFVAQHLAYLDPSDDPQIFYWLKDKSSLKAEVDFIIGVFGEIVPVEVKNNRSAKSRSLNLITEEIKSIKKTIKLSPDEFRIKRHGNITQLEIPIYLTERIPFIVHSV